MNPHVVWKNNYDGSLEVSKGLLKLLLGENRNINYIELSLKLLKEHLVICKKGLARHTNKIRTYIMSVALEFI